MKLQCNRPYGAGSGPCACGRSLEACEALKHQDCAPDLGLHCSCFEDHGFDCCGCGEEDPQ